MVLAAATHKSKSEVDDEEEEGPKGKRVQVDWSVNIGEHALEIAHMDDEAKTTMVLGMPMIAPNRNCVL